MSIEQLDNTDKNLHSRGRVIDISARRAQVSPTTYFKGREIIKNAPEDIKDQLRKGKVKIDKVYRQLQKQQERQELVNAAASILQFPTNNIKLVLGDFIEKSKEFISDNSINLLFTDPIYGLQYLPLYDNLTASSCTSLKRWWKFGNVCWELCTSPSYIYDGICRAKILVDTSGKP